MAVGWWSTVMAGAGGQPSAFIIQAGSRIATVGAGSIPTAAGIGIRDYAWGATFHYGRWFHDTGNGWCWYPDTVWAPSWVTWRYSNNYCGWAPLPPRTTFQAGVGIVYNGGGVSVGFSFGLGASCFTFVPTQHFCDPHPRNYCVAPAQVTQVYNNTTVINNYNVNNHTIVNHGIALQNIAAVTRTPIQPVPVHEINSMVAHGGQSQPVQPSTAMVPGRTITAMTRDFGSPLRTPWFARQSSFCRRLAHRSHNTTVAMIPQRQLPVVNFIRARIAAPIQAPPADKFQSATRAFAPAVNGDAAQHDA